MSERPSPGAVQSLWLATTPTTEYDPLENGLRVDVAVIGGGITGLTTAINLTEEGRTVAVIESGRIVEGATGHTTAKITSQHGLVYNRLVSEFGPEKARQYAEANEAAIDEIERRAEGGIDCEFQRTTAYTYAVSPADTEQIREEVRAANRLGLPASFVETTPLPFEDHGTVRFDEQGAFHPRKYLLAVAEQIHGDGSYVFEETKTIDIEAGEPCTVKTEREKIVADDVVVATHFPFVDRAGYFARMHPRRAYLLTVRIEELIPEGMFYSTASPPATMRSGAVSESDEELLLVGGQSHKAGDDAVQTSERYRRCEVFARERFTVESVEYRWSTMDYVPVDGVPFVGRIDPLSKHVYVGTGFNGWGISGGTAAGMILADLIVEGSNPWTEVFDPQRLKPKASATEFLVENTNVGKAFLGDWLRTMFSGGDVPATTDAANVTRVDGTPMGLYRDKTGEVHAVSAVCPHMHCLVRWNDTERTWDCPCHGSRFTYKGKRISGPSLEDLPYRKLRSERDQSTRRSVDDS